MTTPIRQLTARMQQLGERQQVLLQALHDFAASVVEERQAAEGELIASCGVGDVAEAQWPLDVDLCRESDGCVDPLLDAVGFRPGICDVEAGRPIDACGDTRVTECDDEPSAMLGIDHPLITSPAGDPATDSTCDEATFSLLGSLGDDVVAVPVTRARPAHSEGPRSSGAPTRKKRDYNYFADLKAKLSQLPKE